MNFNEVKCDLFTVDKKYYLVHCISADFALGRGIAVEFDRRYDMKKKLAKKMIDWMGKSKRPVHPPPCILVDNVFNLVTKNEYWNKPTYASLHLSLTMMKIQCMENGIKHIAMPAIGCGLDKLEWPKVREMIKEVFNNTEVDILVCFN